MRVRSYRAASASEALRRAFSEMGAGARILATRPTGSGVELVVADGPDDSRPDGLDAVRAELRRLSDQMGRRDRAVPPGLEELDRRLRASGLSADLQARVLAAAAPHRGVDALAAAASALAQCVPILPPRSPHADGARLVALVGPTGVGKTTTIAKLAGRLVHHAKRRVALVTLDTYRVGAVEQLRAYADLLDAPFEVAFTPADAARAAERHRERDVVLIDTTGRSPLDAERLGELAAGLRLVERLEVLLVLSATSSPAALADAAARFDALRPTGLVVTKLDETSERGAAFSVAAQRALPVAFLCAGQEVPDDLERASAERVAQLCLPPALEPHEARA